VLGLVLAAVLVQMTLAHAMAPAPVMALAGSPTSGLFTELECIPEYTPGLEYSEHRFTVIHRGGPAVRLEALWTIAQTSPDAFTISDLMVGVGAVEERGSVLVAIGTGDSGRWVDAYLAPGQRATFTYTVNHAGPGGMLEARLGSPAYLGICVITQHVEARPVDPSSPTVPTPEIPATPPTDTPPPATLDPYPTPDDPPPTEEPGPLWACEPVFGQVDALTSVHSFRVHNMGYAYQSVNTFWTIGQAGGVSGSAFAISDVRMSHGSAATPISPLDLFTSYWADWGELVVAPGTYATFFYVVTHVDPSGPLIAQLTSNYWYDCTIAQSVPAPDNTPTPEQLSSSSTSGLACVAEYERVDAMTTVHLFTLTNTGDTQRLVDVVRLRASQNSDTDRPFTISGLRINSGTLSGPTAWPSTNNSLYEVSWRSITVAPGESVMFFYTVTHFNLGTNLLTAQLSSGHWAGCAITQDFST